MLKELKNKWFPQPLASHGEKVEFLWTHAGVVKCSVSINMSFKITLPQVGSGEPLIT